MAAAAARLARPLAGRQLQAIGAWRIGAWASLPQRRGISVDTEPTPNPDSIMFYPGQKDVLGEGTKTKKFNNKHDTNDSPLAAAIFKVKGVSEVLLASHHVTVTKSSVLDWSTIQPSIELVIGQFYAAGLRPVKEGVVERDEVDSKPAFEAGSIEAQIEELMEERVRPFVQQDGGDVEFVRFEPASGAVYVRLHGACSGCPKSNVTLQIGIKNLIEHYIPQVKDVLPVDDEEEYIPRPGDRR